MKELNLLLLVFLEVGFLNFLNFFGVLQSNSRILAF
jgi:hypothetical protein